MNLRANAILAIFCLAAAISARPAPAGPQGSDPVGVGDVPADSHLPTAERATEQPAETATDPTPAPVAKKAKKAKSAETHPSGDGSAASGGAAAGAADAGAATPADGQSNSALIVALRQTGYTLVVRHAEAANTTPDKASADPENEKLEQELDAAGRQQAKMLGVAYRALDVPIGEVLSSPAFRALETVKIARIGEPIVEPKLDEGEQGMATPASTGAEPSGGSAAWLKAAVAKPPRLGTNRLIVTHLPLIISTFGKEYANVAPGETLILKPDGEGDASVIGRLKIEDLKQLAGK